MHKNRKDFISAAVILVFLVFAAIIFFQNIYILGDFEISINYYYILLSIPVFAVYYIFLAGMWLCSYSVIQKPLSFWKSLKVYSSSLLGKYVPGKVWMILSRAYLSRAEGGSAYAGSFSIFLEIFLKLSTALLISIIYIPLAMSQYQASVYIFALLIAGFIIFLHPKIFDPFTSWLYKKIKKEEKPQHSIRRKRILLISFGYIISWYICGIILALISISLGQPLSFEGYLLLTSAFAFSWFISELSFFIPAGLIVREGALIFLLSPHLGIAVATLLALIMRIETIAFDISFAGISRLKN